MDSSDSLKAVANSGCHGSGAGMRCLEWMLFATLNTVCYFVTLDTSLCRLSYLSRKDCYHDVISRLGGMILKSKPCIELTKDYICEQHFYIW